MKEIRRIVELYGQLKNEAVPSALAVVVDVAESSYRRIGARLLVASDGRYMGGISGGCLEGDALRRARTAILSNQPTVHTYDTRDGEDAVIGVGLGCEGRIDVLFLPLDYGDQNNEVELLSRFADTRAPVLLLRSLQTHQQRPVEPRLMTTDRLDPLGRLTGQSTADLRSRAEEVLAGGRSRRITVTGERGYPFPVLCEVLQPEIHLIVTGTNYDIPPTLLAARHLGWRTTLVGARRKFTTEMQRLADRLVDYSDITSVATDAATAVVMMSHDYDWDLRMVRHFLPQHPAYLGLLGPRKRTVKLAEQLQAENGPDLLGYPNLFAPVGLDVGAETPEEIATSLTAEIIAVFRSRNGGYLRERATPIHER